MPLSYDDSGYLDLWKEVVPVFWQVVKSNLEFGGLLNLQTFGSFIIECAAGFFQDYLLQRVSEGEREFHSLYDPVSIVLYFAFYKVYRVTQVALPFGQIKVGDFNLTLVRRIIAAGGSIPHPSRRGFLVARNHNHQPADQPDKINMELGPPFSSERTNDLHASLPSA